MKSIHLPLRAFSLCLLPFFSVASDGEEIEKKQFPPSTPLTRAIRLEKFDEAKTLIQPKWINMPDRGQYHPLTYAAYTANNDLIKALLEAGADPNVIESNGKTALYVTANLANLKGLELLKKYGAEIQSGQALSPAVAAVHSGSLECLKALLRISSETDLDRGWENRTIGGSLLSEAPGDPVSYAAYHGYDEMAIFLLSKGARLVGRDSVLQNALHHAAINPQCSVELVRKLIEHGCPPLSQSSAPRLRELHVDQVPRTPLEYAALAGSFEKVQAMLFHIDPQKDRDGVRRAAHMAAAYRRDKIAAYLFGLLDEQIPTYPEFAGREKPDEAGVPKVAAAMESDELNRLRPRTKARPGKMPLSGSLAIVSDPQLSAGASLLSVELSKQDGIQMLERDQMDAVIAEQSLQGMAEDDSLKLHRSLDLIPAKHVVVMSRHELENKAFVRVAVVDTASGLVVITLALPLDVATSPEGAKELSASVLFAIADDTDNGTAVSLATVTSETGEAETANLARNLNTLLPHLVGNTKGCANLSRDQLRHLQLEKAIGVEGSYWAAAWVVDGGVGAVDQGQAELTLRAIHAVDKTEIKASRFVRVTEVEEGIRLCWNDLVSRMKLGPTDSGPAPVAKEALEKEAEVLQRHSRWLFEAGYYAEAAVLMDACLALGKHTQERVKLALMVRLNIAQMLGRERYKITGSRISYYAISRPFLATYGEKGMYGEAYHDHPRSNSHESRQVYLDSVDHFIRLGELAEARIRIKPGHENVYGWTSLMLYDRDIEATLNPYVSNAISQLTYVATVLDHAMVLAAPANQRVVQDIGGQIERVTTLYLDHLERYKDADERRAGSMKISTLEYLFHRDFDYFARYFPNLFERMMTMMRGVIEAPGSLSKTDLTRLYQLASSKILSTREAGLNQASESWWTLHQSLQKRGLEQELTLLSTAPMYRQTSRAGRLEWLKFLCDQSVCLSDGAAVRTAIGSHPIGDLIGMDERLQEKVSSQTAESALLADMDDLPETAEYLRMAAFYRAIDDLRAGSEPFIAGFLKRRPEIEKGKNYSYPSLEWSHEAWRSIRSALVVSRKLNPEIMGLLDKLDGDEKKNGLAEDAIDLSAAELLVLPEQPGHGQRTVFSIPERATIAGDELWLPGFSIRERLRWSEDGETDSDNVIQVISLKSRSVRTVTLPRLTIKYSNSGHFLGCSQDRRAQGRVGVAKDFAYHTPDGRHLFYIRRDNLEVGEIHLPEGFENLELEVMDTHPNMNLLLVIATNRGGDGDSLRQVLLIGGKRVETVLVSNRRKPEESPIDRADFVPDIVEFNDDSVWVGLSKKRLGHVYNLDTGEWSKLSDPKLYGMMHRTSLDADYDYCDPLPHKLYSHFLDAPRGVNCGYWHIHTNYNRITLELPPKDDFARHMLGQIEVKVPPIEHSAFQRKWFPKCLLEGKDDKGAEVLWSQDRAGRKGWWITPDEAIQQGLYKAVIMGKWSSNYLIGLKCVNMDDDSQEINWLRQEYGVPAVWLLPESAFEAGMKTSQERYSRLIDFTSAWLKGHWENTAKIDARNSKKDFRWVSQRPVEMSGGGAIFAIQPVVPVKDMQLVINISRKKWDRKIHFRLEVGEEQKPTEIFNSEQHEISKAAEYNAANLYLPLPDEVREIRLINESPRDHALRINKILFLPKGN